MPVTRQNQGLPLEPSCPQKIHACISMPMVPWDVARFQDYNSSQSMWDDVPTSFMKQVAAAWLPVFSALGCQSPTQ